MGIEYLRKVIRIVGSEHKLGKKLGLRQSTINNWINSSKIVPAKYVIPIEKIVDKQVTRHQLRPDIYPLED